MALSRHGGIPVVVEGRCESQIRCGNVADNGVS
jgi:hypothetical protein